MKRHAYVIESSSVFGEKDLPGAYKDAVNWKRFLMSPAGGAWKDIEEISFCPSPKSYVINAALEYYYYFGNDDTYVLVVFSGHGFEKHYSDGRSEVCVCLNDHEKEVPISRLTPRSYGTAIFDCCRGVEHVQGFAQDGALVNESFTLVKNGRAGGSMSLNQARTLFDGYLNRCVSYEPITMFSCSSNESAGEDENAGGYYTTLLLTGARKWCSQGDGTPALYSTFDAHRFVIGNMPKVNPQQHPSYLPRECANPFAVRV